MDSVNSFKSYSKEDELENQAYQKKTRKRMIILIISSIVLITVVITGVVITLLHTHKTNSGDSVSSTELTPAGSLKAVCNVTLYPNSCISSISSLPTYSNTTNPQTLFKFSLQVAINDLSKLAGYMAKLKGEGDVDMASTLAICGKVVEDAVGRVNDSASSLEGDGGEAIMTPDEIEDFRTWLSASMTDLETCMDTIKELGYDSATIQNIHDGMGSAMRNSTESTSNSLAIVTKILRVLARVNKPSLLHGRRLLGLGFPAWVGPTERRLMTEEVEADVVVAKDGSGRYRTVGEAVREVERKSERRFVIYVKEGVYVENVELEKDMWNVMIFGDGKNKTIISGSRNAVDGTHTFDTATFAVSGKGFMARDIGFVNNAGPEKHQAVAVRSGSDRSVFYQCSFDGYQDTLYAHSNRQFYRECDITGTVDFIFGNAASVFQNCTIRPREPLSGQFNTITAQGKTDPNQNTGIVIQNSNISALGNLNASTYLGRPWKNYSTTVIMKSEIGPFLDPLGWAEWNTDEEPPSTIFYAEYQNTGPGSNVSERVQWAGYRPNISEDEAREFTVESLIQASQWLPNTHVEFQSSL